MSLYACVTGADRGLGLELVKKLLESGYTVFAGRYNRQLTLLDELQSANKELLYTVELDVTKDESVRSAADFICSKTDALDLLINNSAILGDTESTIFDRLDFDEMLRVFNTNSIGALRVSNALIGLLIAGGKKLIINISSEAGSIGACRRKSWFAYCMSKTAINMQSTLIHNSLAEIGGQVIVIHPGWMKTWMKGNCDDNAQFTPDIPAGHIVDIIRNSWSYKGEKPAYIDHLGNRLEW